VFNVYCSRKDNEKSYIYNEIIAFLISISSKKVIPYIEKTLFTESKIDDELYTELKNNLSDEFAELRKKLLLLIAIKLIIMFGVLKLLNIVLA